MRRYAARAVMMAFICLSLGACLGKAPPVEEYLRLDSAGKCAQGEANGGLVVAMKSFVALDNLDRQAVMTAMGRVLTPSLRWYYEASPEMLVEEAVTAEIACQPGFAGATQYRTRLVHDAGLVGAITAFNLQEEGGTRFVIALRLELWSANFKRLLASTVVESSESVAALDAHGVAEAASKALASASEKTALWLASARELIEKSKADEASAE